MRKIFIAQTCNDNDLGGYDTAIIGVCTTIQAAEHACRENGGHENVMQYFISEYEVGIGHELLHVCNYDYEWR